MLRLSHSLVCTATLDLDRVSAWLRSSLCHHPFAEVRAQTTVYKSAVSSLISRCLHRTLSFHCQYGAFQTQGHYIQCSHSVDFCSLGMDDLNFRSHELVRTC